MFHVYFLLTFLHELGWPRKKGLPFFRTSYYSLAVLERAAREMIRVGLVLGNEVSMKIVTEIMTENMDVDISEIEEDEDLELFVNTMNEYAEVFLETQDDPIFTYEDTLPDWEKAGFIEESDDLLTHGVIVMGERFLGALWLALTNEPDAIEEKYQISSSDWLLAATTFVEYEKSREMAGEPPLKMPSDEIRSFLWRHD